MKILFKIFFMAFVSVPCGLCVFIEAKATDGEPLSDVEIYLEDMTTCRQFLNHGLAFLNYVGIESDLSCVSGDKETSILKGRIAKYDVSAHGRGMQIYPRTDSGDCFGFIKIEYAEVASHSIGIMAAKASVPVDISIHQCGIRPTVYYLEIKWGKRP